MMLIPVYCCTVHVPSCCLSGVDNFTMTASQPCEPTSYCRNATRFNCPSETVSLEYGQTVCSYLSCAGSGYWNGTNTAVPDNPPRCLVCGENYNAASKSITNDSTPEAWYCTRVEVTKQSDIVDIFNVTYSTTVAFNVTTRTYIPPGIYSIG
jgi:hypothetical protein